MSLSLEQARQQEPSYRPHDPEVLRRLADVILVPIIGPTAVGKNYLISQSGLSAVATTTSRELRPDDASSQYIHTSNQDLLARIEAGELVQYVVLGDHTIYGTTIESYQPGPNALPFVARDVDRTTTIGYQDVRPIGIVAPIEVWKPRVEKRLAKLSIDQRRSRLDEAAISIQWLIDATASNKKLVVVNDEKDQAQVVADIRAFANGHAVPTSNRAMQLAHEMSSGLEKVRTEALGETRHA